MFFIFCFLFFIALFLLTPFPFPLFLLRRRRGTGRSSGLLQLRDRGDGLAPQRRDRGPGLLRRGRRQRRARPGHGGVERRAVLLEQRREELREQHVGASGSGQEQPRQERDLELVVQREPEEQRVGERGQRRERGDRHEERRKAPDGRRLLGRQLRVLRGQRGGLSHRGRWRGEGCGGRERAEDLGALVGRDGPREGDSVFLLFLSFFFFERKKLEEVENDRVLKKKKANVFFFSFFRSFSFFFSLFPTALRLIFFFLSHSLDRAGEDTEHGDFVWWRIEKSCDEYFFRSEKWRDCECPRREKKRERKKVKQGRR